MKASVFPALLGIAMLALPACASNPETVAEAPAAETDAGPAAGETFEPKMVALPFRVDVSYSSRAREAMRESGAWLNIVANYYGTPKTPGAAGLDPQLGVWLGGDHHSIDSSRTAVTFPGEFDAARVAREVIGDARVRVIASPIRGAGKSALVVCSEFDEALPLAVETGGFVHCTLKGE